MHLLTSMINEKHEKMKKMKKYVISERKEEKKL